jgi:hypothetical protein
VSSFKRKQLEDLGQLGVTAEQLSELRRVLPICRASIRAPRARMSDVRDELRDLLSALQTASTALERWESPGVRPPALAEAQARVIDEDDAGDEGSATGDAAVALERAQFVVDAALDRLPKRQRRARASWWPVRWIHAALERGWTQAHYPARRGRGAGRNDRVAIPPYPHSPSSGVTSPFRKIVCICYDAALGTRDNDPERAIKSFMRWRAAAKRNRGRQVP